MIEYIIAAALLPFGLVGAFLTVGLIVGGIKALFKKNK
jgi:hypothetical protein